MPKINPSELRSFNRVGSDIPLSVDLVYAQADHTDNIFKTAIYKSGAECWCHVELFDITCRAAQICHEKSGYSFEVKDALRPYEAQAAMQETAIVKANPHWCEQPNRLLSPPGGGGHPRGMAVDIILLDKNGNEVDMGTPFDYLTENPEHNPAARNFDGFDGAVLGNRKLLETSMMQAAHELNRELLPLPQEWWDFRFPKDYTHQFDPILDAELPSDMQMMDHKEK